MEGRREGREDRGNVREKRVFQPRYLNVVARDAACICTCIVERVERVAFQMQTGNVLVISGDLADDSL